MPTFYEFFCGGGMARQGLGPGWRCLFANDIDPKKAQSYRQNFGGEHLRCRDVGALTPSDLPGLADLAWASFPCQDLSLAGDGRGLGPRAGTTRSRSGAFWPFWKLMSSLKSEGRGPRLIVLENVLGLLTSNGGKDFRALARTLAEGGYRFGALQIDASLFLPQSRPRLFILALDRALAPPAAAKAAGASVFRPPPLRAALERLPAALRASLLEFDLPLPAGPPARLSDLLEASPPEELRHPPAETARLLSSMSPANLKKLDAARRSGRLEVGALYRRTRPAPGGGRQVRAEVRFDGVAGCLRTPAGGSSRQKLLVVSGSETTSRLLSAREAARLMGLSDAYVLPTRQTEALKLLGDGVAPPVVRHLAEHLLEPLLEAARALDRPAKGRAAA